MKRDFTTEILIKLLGELKNSGYIFIPFAEYKDCLDKKIIILRHDVDKNPLRAVKFAALQKEIDIRGTYYFRIVKESFDEKIINKIASMGHEIGYHYEDLSMAKGNYEKAYRNFIENLKKFRKYYPVKTICMHGSPLSRWDNKKIWEKYKYTESGITGEPYFDLDLNEVYYITDTGRKWDGSEVSIRDKVNSKFKNKYRTTQKIIQSIKENSFPDKAMFTFHPQRWNDNLLSWSNELLLQKTKNIIKKVIVNKK